jgi:hypothetical protein
MATSVPPLHGSKGISRIGDVVPVIKKIPSTRTGLWPVGHCLRILTSGAESGTG